MPPTHLLTKSLYKFVEILDLPKEPHKHVYIESIEGASRAAPYVTVRNKNFMVCGIYIKPDTQCRILTTKETLSLFDMSQWIKLASFSGCMNGTDPEIFVVDQSNAIIPAFKFLPSKTKGNPFWDGFQAEFTTVNTHCLAYLVDAIRSNLKLVLDSARIYDKTATLTWKNVLDVPGEMLATASPEHLALGCAPSLNIYGSQVLIPDPMSIPFRSAGCHLHFGLGGKLTNTNQITSIIKGLDLLFGLVSVSLLQGMEDPRRRFFYGRAGEYRLPNWGIEYRVPSSAILAHPALFHICYDLARAALYLSKNYPILFKRVLPVREAQVIDIINYNDVKAAKKYLITHKTILLDIIRRLYVINIEHELLFNMIINGFKNYIDVSNMEHSWRLKTSWLVHSESVDCSVHNLGVLKKL